MRRGARMSEIARKSSARDATDDRAPSSFAVSPIRGHYMQRSRVAARIAALSWCAVCLAGVLPAQKPSMLERTVDASVKPGDDFFAYANGAWLKATGIPEGKDRWNARDEITERTRERLAALLSGMPNASPGSLARKVADFRAAWLNEPAIEEKGPAPLRPLLDSIGAISDKDALIRQLGRSMRADVDPLNWGIYQSSSLLGLSVEPSIHGEKRYVAFLVQGGLGLPDREQYVSTEPRTAALRAKYKVYVSSLLAFAGVDHADRRAESVVALETAIAETHATREASANDHNADHLWT